MSNKRITDLTELTNPTTDDVFPVVDIATNTTTKVQLGNLPVPSSVTTALATKQDSLVSGTNIKTINSTSVLGSGNIAVQETLVSGTNIKTINSTSLLGSGNITIAANPSGVSGAIQFSNGSAFASDAANLFWDDTNNRLGVGTNAPVNIFQVKTTQANANGSIAFGNQTNATILAITDTGSALTQLQFRASSYNFTDCVGMRIAGSGYSNVATAMLQVVGSGSTSATTSLLVQNSAGSTIFSVRDDGRISFNTENAVFGPNGPTIDGSNCVIYRGGYNTNSIAFNLSKLNITDSNGVVFSNNYNTALTASAMVDIQSTTKGFLMPRMTTTQINAIASPANGLEVYNTTLNCPCFYNGTSWRQVTNSAM